MEIGMPARIGKVKIYTQDGKLIREGLLREDDITNQKILKYFTPGEFIKAAVLIVGFIFTAGALWVSINDHFKQLDNDASIFVKSFGEFKQEEADFNKNIYFKLDDKDKRINCLAENQARCCLTSPSC
jgi:hypothetical protein